MSILFLLLWKDAMRKYLIFHELSLFECPVGMAWRNEAFWLFGAAGSIVSIASRQVQDRGNPFHFSIPILLFFIAIINANSVNSYRFYEIQSRLTQLLHHRALLCTFALFLNAPVTQTLQWSFESIPLLCSFSYLKLLLHLLLSDRTQLRKLSTQTFHRFRLSFCYGSF